jgi:hypothetical protein
MADIKNYTPNFVSGRRAAHGLTCATHKLASNEIQLLQQRAAIGIVAGGR